MKYADFDFVRQHKEDAESSGGEAPALDPVLPLVLEPPVLPEPAALPEALDFRVAATVAARIDALGMAQPLALLHARRAAAELAAGQVLELRCAADEDLRAWHVFARISGLLLSALPGDTPDQQILQLRRG